MIDYSRNSLLAWKSPGSNEEMDFFGIEPVFIYVMRRILLLCDLFRDIYVPVCDVWFYRNKENSLKQ